MSLEPEFIEAGTRARSEVPIDYNLKPPYPVELIAGNIPYDNAIGQLKIRIDAYPGMSAGQAINWWYGSDTVGWFTGFLNVPADPGEAGFELKTGGFAPANVRRDTKLFLEFLVEINGKEFRSPENEFGIAMP